MKRKYTKEEKREFKRNIDTVAKMVEDAKSRLTSHVITTARETVPCWDNTTEED
tara:strand:+ start:859 stop:1020 length:162 start_codon:yes stop_codon:yes gene_type:complete